MHLACNLLSVPCAGYVLGVAYGNLIGCGTEVRPGFGLFQLLQLIEGGTHVQLRVGGRLGQPETFLAAHWSRIVLESLEPVAL